jgi:hypothetical protein
MTRRHHEHAYLNAHLPFLGGAVTTDICNVGNGDASRTSTIAIAMLNVKGSNGQCVGVSKSSFAAVLDQGPTVMAYGCCIGE